MHDHVLASEGPWRCAQPLLSCRDARSPLPRRVTNVALSALLSSLPHLRRLSLYWNLNVGVMTNLRKCHVMLCAT